MRRLLLVLVLLLTLVSPAFAQTGDVVRLQDIATIQGATDNQLEGIGLVVGLDQTGDTTSTGFTEKLIKNLVTNAGVYIAQDSIRVKNVAVVAVRAILPPFAKPGQHIDVTVGSIGDAMSLANGILIGCDLRGPDGKVYATAEGPLSTGGFGVSANGSSVRMNNTLVARIPNGAIVQRAVPVTMLDSNGFMYLNLRQPDFVTAARVASTISKAMNGDAEAVDAATIRVYVNSDYRDHLVDLIARLEQLPVQPDMIAKVVIDERTGTIIMGSNVRIGAVAVTQGGLVVKVQTSQTVSQPNALSPGATTVTTQSNISAQEQKAKSVVFQSGTTLGQLVRALNAIGTTPRSLISILEAIKAEGALNADLQLI